MSLNMDDLHSGASPDGDAYEREYGPSRETVRRIVDELMTEDSAPSTTPLPSAEHGGPPVGYGKWGDLA